MNSTPKRSASNLQHRAARTAPALQLTVPPPSHHGTKRRGLILVIVMIVIVMVSLAGFGYVASMSGENNEVQRRGEKLQMAAAIESAEEFLKQYFERPKGSESSSSPGSPRSAVLPASKEDDELLMRGVVVSAVVGPGSVVRFTLTPARDEESTMAPWR